MGLVELTPVTVLFSMASHVMSNPVGPTFHSKLPFEYTLCSRSVAFSDGLSTGTVYTCEKGEAGALSTCSVTTCCSEVGSWNIAAP